MTTKRVPRLEKYGTQNLISRMGGASVVARICRISRPAVSQWERIPAHHVLKLEEKNKAGVTRHDMRPDIYPAGV